jgi:hypothetical protein
VEQGSTISGRRLQGSPYEMRAVFPCCIMLLRKIREKQQSFATSSSLKLDVGGGFLGCLWKFNEIKSKTVRAFAQRVEDLVFVFKFISVQIGFLVSLAVFDEAVDQTA